MWAIRNKTTGRFLVMTLDKDTMRYPYQDDDREHPVVDVRLYDSDFGGAVFVTTKREFADELVTAGTLTEYKESVDGANSTSITNFNYVRDSLEVVSLVAA